MLLHGESRRRQAHGRRSDCCYASFTEQGDARHKRKLTKLKKFHVYSNSNMYCRNTTIRRN